MSPYRQYVPGEPTSASQNHSYSTGTVTTVPSAHTTSISRCRPRTAAAPDICASPSWPTSPTLALTEAVAARSEEPLQRLHAGDLSNALVEAFIMSGQSGGSPRRLDEPMPDDRAARLSAHRALLWLRQRRGMQ